jgi:hypothetical protein
MRASTSNIGPAKILTGVSGRWSITPSSVTATTVGTRALTLIRTGSGFVSRGQDPGPDEGLVGWFDGQSQQQGRGGKRAST